MTLLGHSAPAIAVPHNVPRTKPFEQEWTRLSRRSRSSMTAAYLAKLNADQRRAVEHITAQVFGATGGSMADALSWSGTFHSVGARLLREYAPARIISSISAPGLASVSRPTANRCATTS